MSSISVGKIPTRLADELPTTSPSPTFQSRGSRPYSRLKTQKYTSLTLIQNSEPSRGSTVSTRSINRSKPSQSRSKRSASSSGLKKYTRPARSAAFGIIERKSSQQTPNSSKSTISIPNASNSTYCLSLRSWSSSTRTKGTRWTLQPSSRNSSGTTAKRKVG